MGKNKFSMSLLYLQLLVWVATLALLASISDSLGADIGAAKNRYRYGDCIEAPHQFYLNVCPVWEIFEIGFDANRSQARYSARSKCAERIDFIVYTGRAGPAKVGCKQMSADKKRGR